MEREWYFWRDGEQRGPLTAEEMQQMLAEGEIAPSDPVWKESMPDWQKAVKRPEFYWQAEEPAPSAAGRGWYYVRGETKAGPFPLDTMRRLIAAGDVGADDLVWSEGMNDWQPARNLPVFFSQEPQVAQTEWPQEQYAPSPAVLNYHTPERHVVYAGFWLRFCAVILDGMILNVLNGAIKLVFKLILSGGGLKVSTEVEIFLGVLSLVVEWLYAALQESSAAQATLGKRALGIVVTNLQGERITFGRATGRHFAKYVSAIILMIGYIMAAFTEKKQALHDIMAGCLVVRKKRGY
jgi:uncharacterized RDD family membrane protein YckC